MRKRNLVRAVAFVCAALAVLAGFLLQERRRSDEYRLALNNTYRRAFTGFAVSVREVANSLEKSRYCTGGEASGALCLDLYGKASAACAALEQLPGAERGLEKTSTFLARVGDYACSLAGLDELGQEELDNLAGLSEAARKLSDALESLSVDVDSGTVTVARLSSAEDALPELADSIQAMETEFPQVPTLIYDGPFSEHLLQQTPRFLEGKSELTQQQAQQTAAQALRTDTGRLRFEWERDGTVPAYTFSCVVNSGDKYVTVTKQGGALLSVLAVREVFKANLSQEDGVKIAASFLSAMGYDGMRETYYQQADNVLTVNFAHMIGDVICYPDLIKVSVALDNGEIMGLDALGYVMSHGMRTLTTPTVTETQAAASVSAELETVSSRLALIPTGGKYEKLCYEFLCRSGDGAKYLVYVSAETGKQAKILILLEDENGTLTV